MDTVTPPFPGHRGTPCGPGRCAQSRAADAVQCVSAAAGAVARRRQSALASRAPPGAGGSTRRWHALVAARRSSSRCVGSCRLASQCAAPAPQQCRRARRVTLGTLRRHARRRRTSPPRAVSRSRSCALCVGRCRRSRAAAARVRWPLPAHSRASARLLRPLAASRHCGTAAARACGDQRLTEYP